MDQSAPTRRKSPTPLVGEGLQRWGNREALRPAKGQNPPRPLYSPRLLLLFGGHRQQCRTWDEGASERDGKPSNQTPQVVPTLVAPTSVAHHQPHGEKKAVGGFGPQCFHCSLQTFVISPELISATTKTLYNSGFPPMYR